MWSQGRLKIPTGELGRKVLVWGQSQERLERGQGQRLEWHLAWHLYQTLLQEEAEPVRNLSPLTWFMTYIGSDTRGFRNACKCKVVSQAEKGSGGNRAG